MKLFHALISLLILYATPIYAQQFQTSVLSGIGLSEGYWGGVSGRVGYLFQNGIYFGGQFTHHFGEEIPALSPNSDETLANRINARYYGGEIGYDIQFGRFTLRPYASLGYMTQMSSIEQSISEQTVKFTASSTIAYYSGGTVFQWKIFQRYYIGGDIRALTLREFGGLLLSGFFTLGFDF